MSAAAPAVELPRAMLLENAVETAIREYAEARPMNPGPLKPGAWWNEVADLALHITKALPDVRTQMLREVIADRAIAFAAAQTSWRFGWDHAATIDQPVLLDDETEMSRLRALRDERTRTTNMLLEVVGEYQKGGAT